MACHYELCPIFKQVEIKRAEPIRPEAALLTPEPADPTKVGYLCIKNILIY